MMTKYEGRLTAAEAAAGMTTAVRNARRLSVDAGVMLDMGSFPTAASLAALSIEETGKVSLLRMLALARTDDEAKMTWRDYRNHRSKNGLWILPKLKAEGTVNLDQLHAAVNSKAEHTALLDAIKQLGFYTDCFGKGHWSMPEEVIDQNLASGLVQIATR
jgi:AbiV family abortive infection protein